MEKEFRSDINGLRAIAVAAVLLYHFGVAGFSGGFVGVDIFFVISGYLMTRIVLTGMANGRFSVLAFYGARARRIVPALAILCIALLAYGFVRLTPPDYMALGRHIASSATFTSNLDYWKDIGYFNPNAIENWLLHTWSLSVEWQFYLLYPLVLLGAKRLWLNGKWAAFTVCGLLASSLLLSIVLTHFRPVAAFYLIPTRGWEMLAGAAVFLAPSAADGLRRSVSNAGLALIALSIAFIDSRSSWPGFMAAVPVCGTALIIWANASDRWWLSNRAMQILGACSYSVYLWHWPVVVFLNRDDRLGSSIWMILGIAGSVALGWTSYRLIEIPARRLFVPAGVRMRIVLPSISALIAVAGLVVFASKGEPARPQMARYATLKAQLEIPTLANGWCHIVKFKPDGGEIPNLAWQDSFGQCFEGDLLATRTVLLWGDSHAAHYAPFVSSLAEISHVKVRELSTPGCPPITGSLETGINPEVCVRIRAEAVKDSGRVDMVIMAGRWEVSARSSKFEQQLRQTIQSLGATGKNVVLLGQGPLFRTNIASLFVYKELFGGAMPERAQSDDSVREANAIVSRVARETGARFVEPLNFLCRADGCALSIDGVMPFHDEDHLNVRGSKALAEHLSREGFKLF